MAGGRGTLLKTCRAQFSRRAPGGVRGLMTGQPAPWTHPHLLGPEDATLGISRAEYRGRRERLQHRVQCAECSHVGHTKVILMHAHPVQSRCGDVEYPFYQNSHFWYLTGLEEPDAALVMLSEGGGGVVWETHLFIRGNDPSNLLWDGPNCDLEGAQKLLGIDNVHQTSDLRPFLSKLKKACVFHDLSAVSNRSLTSRCKSFLVDAKSRHPVFSLIDSLRVVKSEGEKRLLRQSCEVASLAVNHAMGRSYPGVRERAIAADFTNQCIQRGATDLAFPVVAAGGNQACTLHYTRCDQTVRAGQLVTVDAGCLYGNYSSDLSRAWPVSGAFSPAQRTLYQLVLDVNTSCIAKLAQQGVSLQEVHQFMQGELRHHLSELGVKPPPLRTGVSGGGLTDPPCPHYVGHHLGISLHDCPTFPRSEPLKADMCITIEPGLYFNADHPHVHREFKGIGIRIEDNVLIREGQPPEILTALAAKTVQEVESLRAS